MEQQPWLYYSLSLLSFLFILLLSKLFFNKQSLHRNLPPSPPSLPIIGHLHLIKQPVHRSLQSLSYKYGPILSLRFGSRPVIVVSSPSAVEDCFTKNDIILANRPSILITRHLHYDNTTIGTASYGPLWRNLRRVATLAVFSNTQLNTYLSVRQDEIRALIKNLFRDSRESSSVVEMRSRLLGLTFNIVMRVIAGKRYFGDDVEDIKEAERFQDVIGEIFELSGAVTPEDYLPFLQWIDLRGTKKKMVKLRNESDEFSQGLIEEHRSKNGGKANTVIDTMLSLQESEPGYYTDDIIKGIITILITGGTDTSSATIEWAMSLLLNHPNELAKAREEVNKYVGHNRLVDESDIPKLQFLQSVVNETLRLFPVAPMLLPHVASEDCKIGGYDVPQGTMILVNAWALHRNPEVWDEPTTFRPERFEGGGSEGYKFVPFGTGRRQCPGAGLANRVIVLAFASLIQCFEWERVSEEFVDLTEGIGLTMPKKKPLEAICRAREQMIDVLSEL